MLYPTPMTHPQNAVFSIGPEAGNYLPTDFPYVFLKEKVQ